MFRTAAETSLAGETAETRTQTGVISGRASKLTKEWRIEKNLSETSKENRHIKKGEQQWLTA
jgi:hypothetical protein